MSSEPATKKIKLELSDPDEPLTRKDVIAFQKEALYRCLNQYKKNLGALQEQFNLTKSEHSDNSKKMADLIAILIALSNSVLHASEVDSEKELCEKIINGDISDMCDSSDDIINLFAKYVGNNGKDTNSDILQQIKNSEKIKHQLLIENKQLTKEIDAIKTFYQNEIRKYDREDSLTVKRIFKKDLDDNQNKDSNKSSEVDEKPIEKTEFPKSESPGNHVENNTIEESTNEKILRESKISNLELEVELLKRTISDLEAFRTKNEKELTTLRIQLSQKSLVNDQAQDEILIQRLNTLTNENAKLSRTNDEFLKKFQSLSNEMEIYNGTLTKEFELAQDTLKKHNASLEKDLVRIRATRDDLLSKNSILEAQTAKSTMISDLEGILSKLKTQWDKIEKRHNSSETLNQDALLHELQDLEFAFKDISNTTYTKYSEYLNTENLISKLNAEKAKADQKYFAAMRSKDSILIENKNLSKSLGKSNELVSQLKEADKLYQQKIENLNKQLDLSRNNEKHLINSIKEEAIKQTNLNSEVTKQKKLSLGLEEENTKHISLVTNLQGELDLKLTDNKNLKDKLRHLKEQNEKFQKALLSNGGDSSGLAEELDNFRSLVYCTLCSKNWKSTAIKTCGHVFCDDCCKERLSSRMRKCPTCNKAFSSNDLLSIHL